MTPFVEVVIVGLSLGAVYALMGMSVTLVHQASRVTNFALVGIGTGAAVLHWDLVTPGGLLDPGLGWIPALGLALTACALVGLLSEALVTKARGERAALVLLLAWSAVLLAGTNALWGSGPKLLPEAWSGPAFVVGALDVPRQQVATIAIGALAVALVALWARRTRSGLEHRAWSGEPEAAAGAGIDPRSVARRAWMLSSVLAGLATILVSHPVLSDAYEQTFHLPFALGAALFGRFRSLPLTAAGGLALGLVPALLDPGDSLAAIGETRSFIAFCLLFILLFRRPGLLAPRTESEAPEAAAPTPFPAPPPSQPEPVVWAPWVRRVGAGALFALLFGLVPLASGPAAMDTWTEGIGVFLVCASVVMVAGWTGDVPLGQVAFAGFSAFMVSNLTVRLGLPHIVAAPLAATAAVPLALLTGSAALRARGRLPLTVLSLAVTVAASSFLFGPEARWFTGVAPGLERPAWLDVLSDRPGVSYYLLSAALAVWVAWWASNVRRSRTGRAMVAVADSEVGAASVGIDPARQRRLALAAAAFVAGLGGVVHAYSDGQVDGGEFGAFLSIQYFLYATVGGLRSLAGVATVVVVFEVLPALRGGPPGPVAVAVLGGLAMAGAVLAPDGIAGVARRVGVVAGLARRAAGPAQPVPVAAGVVTATWSAFDESAIDGGADDGA